MDRERKSTENEALRSPQGSPSDDEGPDNSTGFALGLVKSNSVVARASMWQQLQQQAKGNSLQIKAYDLPYPISLRKFKRI